MSRIFILAELQYLNSLASVKEKISHHYNAVPLGPWSLDFRLLRATEDQSKYSQAILRMSHRPNEGCVVVDTGSIFPSIIIPATQTQAFAQLMSEKFNTLWATKAAYIVSNGGIYNIGDFVVRLGELRQPGQASSQVKALVCNIELAVSDIEGLAQDGITSAAVVDIGKRLGFAEAKISIQTFQGDAQTQEVRLWYEALNFRS